MSPLHIVHLYPRELGINGDVGNVTALAFRAHAYGLDVHVSNVHRAEDLPQDIDLVHVGSGPADSLALVLPDIARHADSLVALREAGIPFLGISAGWFALGESVTFVDGTRASGAGVFPTRASLTPSRAVGEVELLTTFGTVTGFENHSSRIDDGGLPHFGSVVHGVGSDPSCARDARWDGVTMDASIGTNVHGPLLPMNPSIADALITRAMTRRESTWTIPQTDALSQLDEFARHSRDAVQSRL